MEWNIKNKGTYGINSSKMATGKIIASNQTSSRLHKTVIDYDYFQFMKDDYDYIFIFARGITITRLISHF